MPEDRPPALGAPSLLIAISATRQDLSDLDVAARLAASMGASLSALLVEDPVLLQASSLPLTREYDRRSGSERTIDHPRVDRHLRLRQRRARAHLEGLAGALKLSSTLRTTTGEYLREALRAAFDADFALIDARRQPPSALSAAERRWLLGRSVTAGAAGPGPLRAGAILAAIDDSLQGGRALAVARRLAAGEGARLELFSFAAVQPPGAMPGALRSLAHSARARGCRLLVIPRKAVQANGSADDAEVLSELDRPVLLVG